MVNIRELAATERRLLGCTIVLLEYFFAVVLLIGLGVLGIIHSHGRSLLWWYMVGIGINYIPLFCYAVPSRSTRSDGADRIANSEMSRLRRQQLWLLVPLAGIWSLLSNSTRNR
jgi:hypothetical protein